MEVLRAIITDYVSTREPVGSKVLAQRHSLGVSPATIRNDMAVLEAAGLIVAPHTSAGRVPTERGYRLFVDHIDTIKPLSGAERAAISTLLSDVVDMDDVVERTVRILASLTHQLAVVQYPSLRRSGLRHLEIVELGPRRVLVVVITDTGRVEQSTIETSQEITPGLSSRVSAHLNATCGGLTGREVAGALEGLGDKFAPEDRWYVGAVVEKLTQTLQGEAEERIVLSGTSNLVRSGIDFERTILPVLDALEEQVVLLRLFSQMEDDAVTVSIGSENHHEGLAEVSVVAASYGGKQPREGVARLGVIGPTRMDYPGNIAAVRAVARYLSRILNQDTKES